MRKRYGKGRKRIDEQHVRGNHSECPPAWECGTIADDADHYKLCFRVFPTNRNIHLVCSLRLGHEGAHRAELTHDGEVFCQWPDSFTFEEMNARVADALENSDRKDREEPRR
jgi:hypothetical protein